MKTRNFKKREVILDKSEVIEAIEYYMLSKHGIVMDVVEELGILNHCNDINNVIYLEENGGKNREWQTVKDLVVEKIMLPGVEYYKKQ